jgi:hypothetical protein
MLTIGQYTILFVSGVMDLTVFMVLCTNLNLNILQFAESISNGKLVCNRKLRFHFFIYESIINKSWSKSTLVCNISRPCHFYLVLPDFRSWYFTSSNSDGIWWWTIDVADGIGEADVILASSFEMKQNLWISSAAKYHKLPIFVAKMIVLALTYFFIL